MKTTRLTLLLTLLGMLTFFGCNANKSENLDSNAHQQANNSTCSMPTVRTPNNGVNCRNCYATFKLSSAIQKQSHGHSYTECPVCHKDYLKTTKTKL